MLQGIDLRTLAGQKIDLYADTSIEVVMGGFSLLSLDRRSTTYTTGFEVPRTPNNESLFGYISQPTRNNKVVLDVIITYGLFQQKAILTVLSFGKNYSITLGYSEFVDALKGIQINDVLEDITNPLFNSGTSIVDLFEQLTSNTYYNFFHSYNPGALLKDGGVFIGVYNIIELICTKAGYTANFDASAELTYLYIFARDWYYSVTTTGRYQLNLTFNTQTQYKAGSEIIKDICALTCMYFEVNELTKTVTFRSVEDLIKINPIITDVDTLVITEKEIYSGYNFENKINYTVGEGIVSTYKNGTFTGDGTGKHEILTLGANIPKKVGTLYDLTDVTETVIAYDNETAGTGIDYTVEVDAGTQIIEITTPNVDFKDLTNTFSFLSDIFTAPVIIAAEGHIDMLTANSIMENKIIRSVELGGTYFVESMNYNLNTGKSVLKLIKI